MLKRGMTDIHLAGFILCTVRILLFRQSDQENLEITGQKTETYESLKSYIDLNLDGLKDAVISMLGGLSTRINTRTFQNDMLNINSKDDALTLLIHLGYLAYDNERKEVYIPNQEVADEFRNSVEYSNWEEYRRAGSFRPTVGCDIADGC